MGFNATCLTTVLETGVVYIFPSFLIQRGESNSTKFVTICQLTAVAFPGSERGEGMSGGEEGSELEIGGCGGEEMNSGTARSG